MRHVVRIIQAEGTSAKDLWQQGHGESKGREEGMWRGGEAGGFQIMQDFEATVRNCSVSQE